MTAQRDKRTLIDLIVPLRLQGLTFKEIGKQLGLSKERVRQLWQLSSVDETGKVRA